VRAALTDPDTRLVAVAEVDDPTAGAGEVVVRVRAASLNRADLADVWAKRPIVAGRELAGEVVALGDGVTGIAIGDRVMGLGAGFAELAVLDQDLVMPVPPAMPWESAGATPLAALTMHDALVTNARLAPGETVLIHAGTSGVGVAGIQLAAQAGAARVFATSRSAEKLAVLTDFLGDLACPFAGIDTTTADFAAVVGEATDGRGVDVIVDNVGGSVLAGNVAAAAVKGRIVQVGRLGGRTAELDLEELSRKRLAIIGVTFRTRSRAEVADVVRACRRDVDLASIRVHVARTFTLDDVPAAYEALRRDAHVGKLVIRP
jgi:NADPH2:quinone reductase